MIIFEMYEKMPMISIVIPVYNAENYLKECLDSVLGQTYRNLEIILINDGSCDNSLNICKSYAVQDSRIRLFDCINHGASFARNFGIEHARGDYLCFVDSDDYCSSTMVENLLLPFYNMEECDISLCGIKATDGFEMTSIGGSYTVKEYLEKILIKWKIHLYVGAPYAKMFRMSLITDNKIRFDNSISFAEDFMFNMKALSYARNINIVEDLLYSYRLNVQDSLSSWNRTKMPPKEYWRQRYVVYESFENIYKQYHLYAKYSNEINKELMKYILCSEIYVSRNAGIAIEEKISVLNSMRDNEKVMKCIRTVEVEGITNQIRIFLFRRKSFRILIFLENFSIKIKRLKLQ